MADPVPSPPVVAMPWWVRPGLALIVFALLGMALVMAFVNHDDPNKNIIIGAIIAQLATISPWFFGSSESSQRKDGTIATQSATLAVSTPPASVVPDPAAPSSEVQALAAKVTVPNAAP